MVAVPLRDIFCVLGLTMGLIEHGVGIDPWRQRVKSGLLPERHPLREEGTFPISKQGGVNTGNKNGLWNNFHMRMMIPALMRLPRSAEKYPALSELKLTAEEAELYLHRYKEVSAHVRQWRDGKATLQSLNYPKDPNELPDDLKRLLLSEIENKNNHLTSRLLQAYYAEQSGNYVWYGLPAQTGEYFRGGNTVFSRTHAYIFDEIPQCPLMDIDTDGSLNLKTALSFYMWLAKPSVVEMTTSEFSGAAISASFRLVSFLDYLYQRTDGKIDLRTAKLKGKVISTLKQDIGFQLRLAYMQAFFDDHKEHPDLAVFRPFLPSLKTVRQTLQPQSCMLK